MKLSANFTIKSFTKSQTAVRKNIKNNMTPAHHEAALELFEHVMQPVRDNFGITTISSGYRSAELNKAIGGSSRSQHSKGEAVDFEVPGVSNKEVALWIIDNLDFDQIILEGYDGEDPNSGWIHVSYKSKGNRKDVLTATFDNGKPTYTKGIDR